MSSAIVTSVVTGGSNSHATVASEANTYATDFVNQGVLGAITNTSGVAPAAGSFGVNQNTGSDMNVKVLGTGNTTSTASVAYVTATPSTQDKQVLRARMTSDYTGYAINSNSSGVTVYDWIYLQASATNATTPNAAADNVINLFTSRSSSSSSDTGSPPTYGILLAVVTVANGATAITNSNISDRRTQTTVSTGSTSTTTGWQSLTQAFTFSSLNGNRSATVTTPNDLTGTLTPGMKMSFSRSVTPPTQCTSLNGTTHYYSRASGSLGTTMTFTDDFVVSVWVKMSSYPSSDRAIVSRFNGSNGWSLLVNTGGQVYLDGINGAGNVSYVIASQSLPLNKWVHVAAQLDMSAFAVSPTQSYVMMDGVDVPATVVRGGSNPTSLVQAGNLEIGSQNGGLNNFPGKIAQVAIYSAKVTQAAVRLTMGQTLVGNETSLISAYSFSNSINDLNVTSGNNLTANNGAVATTVDSPFSATEYAILTAISYSNPTSTLILQSPEGGIIPNLTLNTPQYSTQSVPFGFPRQKDKWVVTFLFGSSATTSGTVSNTIYNPGGLNLNVPIGAWNLSARIQCQVTGSGSALQDTTLALSTSASTTRSNPNLVQRSYINTGGASFYLWTAYFQENVSLAAATPFYLQMSATNFSEADIRGDLTSIGAGATYVNAECAYL